MGYGELKGGVWEIKGGYGELKAEVWGIKE